MNYRPTLTAALLTAAAAHPAIAAQNAAGPAAEGTPSGVAAKAGEVNPVKVGTAAPSAPLARPDGTPVTLARTLGGRPAVLIFYRGGWCPFCNRQMAQLQEIAPELTRLGYQIVAVSPDRPEELNKSVAKNKLTYTLLSDKESAAMRAYGIAYRLDDATFDRYKSRGLDLEERANQKGRLLPVPAVFVIDRAGMIQFSYVNPNYAVRLAPEVLLAAARAAVATPTKAAAK